MTQPTVAQLDFFGTNTALNAAPITDQQRQLAAALPARVRLGTMSWSFPGWIGLVYAAGTPEKQLATRGLTAYARHPLLRAVEIDRTYYGPIDAATFANYAAQTPDDFLFTCKAHEECTTARFPKHARYGARQGERNPRLFDVAYASDLVIAPFVNGLGKKAGPLVFQFPPQAVRSPQAFAEKLHAFLQALPRGPTYAVELRNPELLTQNYAEALVATGALHCHNAWGKMPSVEAQAAFLPEATRKTLLIRWLLHAGDNYEKASERYRPFNRLVDEDPGTRARIAALLARTPNDAFVMINNKAEGCAFESVMRLAEALADKSA